jgi:hypothetical protein
MYKVPYRDSKLTKLLISSLGGASRTMLITCVSESSGAVQESLRSIRFSMSAARIRNKPIRFLDPQEKLILELREEIKRLRNENKLLRRGVSQPSQESSGRKASMGRGQQGIRPLIRDSEEDTPEFTQIPMPYISQSASSLGRGQSEHSTGRMAAAPALSSLPPMPPRALPHQVHSHSTTIHTMGNLNVA